MFEDSLMESGGKIKTKSKYWMIGTFVFNGCDPWNSDPDSAAVSRGPAEDGDDRHAYGTAPTPATSTSATAGAGG